MLVCVFKGWNDVGEFVTFVLIFIVGLFGVELFVVIDLEEFVDF